MATLSFIVGIIGNVISVLFFGSPIETFWQVVKKKSTENYEALPYISTLLSMSLWVFYGFVKNNKDSLLVITVSGIGAVSQVIYVSLFLIYASKEIKVKALKLVAVLNIGILGSVIMVTLLAIPARVQLTFLGSLCAATTIAMYASPLSVTRLVIKTKSVEYMPFYLSFFVFLGGGVWSIYAFLIRDYFLGVPNAIGTLLGLAQLVLYSIYKNKTMSAKSTAATMKEEASAHLVKGTMQIPTSMNMVNPK